MPRRTPKSVKKSCDRLWPRLVKERAGWRCERCDTPAESLSPHAFHAHHIYKRNNHRLRWDPRNGVALCAPCHRWAEDYPVLFTAWFSGARPQDVVHLEGEYRKGLIKRQLTDYLALEATLKTMLSDAAGGHVSPSKPVPDADTV